MTNEEHQNLKDGDVVVRIVDKGQSRVGYEAVVFTQVHGSTPFKKIKHQNGSIDSIFPLYWGIKRRKPVKKSGFAKFIKRIEVKT